MAENFDNTAVKLSQGPLGIIALFIVLVHGFASMVLGLGSNLGGTERAILVWFIVLFPVVVFLVFARLVSKHHVKLYPPQAFREESYFVDLSHGRASLDRQDKKAPATVDVQLSEATGSLYWLGHDLMWCADILLRGAPGKEVRKGLDQAIHHLSQVGMDGSSIYQDLEHMRERLVSSEDLTPSLRDEYASQLGFIIDRIGAIAEKAQHDFEEPPHWTRKR